MKKIILIIGLLFFTGLIMPQKVAASRDITVYLFHGETCPHCKDGIEYLESIQGLYPNMKIQMYEVWNNVDNAYLLDKVKKTLGSDSRGVPFFVIGNRYLTGFALYRKADIIGALDYYKNNKNEYEDIVSKIINNETINNNNEENSYIAVDIAKNNHNHLIKQIIWYSSLSILLIGVLVLVKKYEKNKRVK